MHVERNILKKFGLTDWHLKSYDINVSRSTIVLRDYNLYLNGVDGGISSITADRGGITEMSAMLNANEISYLGSSLTNAYLRLSKFDFWVFDVTGDIFEGRVKASGASDGNTLEFRDLELDSVRPSLAMEPDMLLSNLPFSRYVLKHAVIRARRCCLSMMSSRSTPRTSACSSAISHGRHTAASSTSREAGSRSRATRPHSGWLT